MSDRIIVFLVLAACGLVLVAPLLGRSGAPGIADVVMGSAAAASISAFVIAARATARAARKHGKAATLEEP